LLEREKEGQGAEVKDSAQTWIILNACCLELFEACFPRRLITRYQLLIVLLEWKFFVVGTMDNKRHRSIAPRLDAWASLCTNAPLIQDTFHV